MPKTSGRRIYLDFAAATPLSLSARRAYARALDLYGNPSAPHAEGRAAREAIDEARANIALSLAVKAEALVFTSGGTESNNIAILGQKPRHAVTSTIEHSSVLKSFKILETRGTTVTYVAPQKDGVVRAADVLREVGAQTDFVSLHHVQSELGTIQPVAEVGAALRKLKHKIVFHVDAAQSPLWLDASPHTLRADLVSYDAQKVMGPKGVGILFRDFSVDLTPVFGGGTQERGIRPGTENTPAIVAAAVAFEQALAGRKARVAKISALRDYLTSNVVYNIPQVQVLGSTKRRVPNNLFIAIPGVDGDYLAVLLDKEGIAVTPRSACLGSGGALSEAALAVTGDESLARGTIRFSLGPSTTQQELKRAVTALRESLTLQLYGKSSSN